MKLSAAPITAEAPLPLQQHPHFAMALRLMGRDVQLEDLGCGSAHTIARRIGPFGTLRFASRGPIFDPNASPADQTAALRASRLHMINTNDPCTQSIHAAGYRLIVTPAHVAELALCADPHAQWAQTHGKWRNRARQADRCKFKVKHRRFDPLGDHWLFAADALQQRLKGYRALPADLTRAYAACHPADVRLTTAESGRRTIAAMLFLRHGSVATYHIGWRDRDTAPGGIHHAMLMDAAADFCLRGVQRIDLGTVDTESAPGLARFKIGTGAVIRPLGGTWLRLPGL